MDEKHWMAVTSTVMSDDSDIIITLKIKDLWMLDSALSLTCRHPGLSEYMRDWYIHISHEVQQPIIALHPEAKELLIMGWRDENDVPIDYAEVERRNARYHAAFDGKHKPTRQE